MWSEVDHSLSNLTVCLHTHKRTHAHHLSLNININLSSITHDPLWLINSWVRLLLTSLTSTLSFALHAQTRSHKRGTEAPRVWRNSPHLCNKKSCNYQQIRLYTNSHQITTNLQKKKTNLKINLSNDLVISPLPDLKRLELERSFISSIVHFSVITKANTLHLNLTQSLMWLSIKRIWWKLVIKSPTEPTK